MIRYIDESDLEVIFAFIQAVLTEEEPAPAYQSEPKGMAALSSTFSFMQNDQFYPSFYEKAAYLLCSIAGAQHFSNGNKRLAVASLFSFLIKNERKFNTSHETYRGLLRDKFPDYQWEENVSIHQAHPLLLYNLAIVIGDPNVWGTDDFSELKAKVSEILSTVYE